MQTDAVTIGHDTRRQNLFVGQQCTRSGDSDDSDDGAPIGSLIIPPTTIRNPRTMIAAASGTLPGARQVNASLVVRSISLQRHRAKPRLNRSRRADRRVVTNTQRCAPIADLTWIWRWQTVPADRQDHSTSARLPRRSCIFFANYFRTCQIEAASNTPLFVIDASLDAFMNDRLATKIIASSIRRSPAG